MPKQKHQNNQFEEILSSYDHYLNHTQGLTLGTRKLYSGYIQFFLQTCFGSQKINFSLLCENMIVRFLMSYKRKGTDHRAQAMGYSLRSFLRFLRQTGAIRDDLEYLVPWIRVRKNTTFPEFFKFDDLQILLDTCDRNRPGGLRDYAILTLLIQLGVRASEVCSLTLDDFDWDKSEIIIRGKGTVSRFPIYKELGDAIVAYLLNGRPKCSCRALFITVKKPYQGFQTSFGVRGVLRKILKQAGLNPKRKGTHLLRHSFAMELLRQGASLYEISSILRHKDIATTAIYARVDFEKLSIIATPWPIQEKKGGSK